MILNLFLFLFKLGDLFGPSLSSKRLPMFSNYVAQVPADPALPTAAQHLWVLGPEEKTSAVSVFGFAAMFCGFFETWRRCLERVLRKQHKRSNSLSLTYCTKSRQQFATILSTHHIISTKPTSHYNQIN